MSAIEVIEEIKKLPTEERQKVFEFLRQVEEALEQRNGGATFDDSLRWAVEEHRDLLRRLAQ